MYAVIAHSNESITEQLHIPVEEKVTPVAVTADMPDWRLGNVQLVKFEIHVSKFIQIHWISNRNEKY